MKDSNAQSPTTSPDELRRLAADMPGSVTGRALLAAANEITDLRISVIAFGGPVMAQLAIEHGLPRNHLYASHYDILERAGARMSDFTRSEL